MKIKNNYSFLIRDLSFYKYCIKLKIKRCGKHLVKLVSEDKKIQYPKTLQLPITNACNLDCVMCNIHMNDKSLIPLEEFEKKIVSSKLLKSIKAVGVNGGEPFLLKNIDEYIKLILNLPKLKGIYIISNGTLTDQVLIKLKAIKEMCSKKGISLTISFSLDGVGEIHDIVRNKKGCFEALMKTVGLINNHREEYCDNLNFICTISRYNVKHLIELDNFAKRNGFSINYNIATIHKRLKNNEKYEDFSILNDRYSCLLAAEFFYKKFIETNLSKYFALFLYLYDEKHIRYGECQYLHNAITITPEGDVCYCATWSDVLGNIKENDLEELYFNNRSYNEQIKENYCKHCSHYLIDTDHNADVKLEKARLSRYGKAW